MLDAHAGSPAQAFENRQQLQAADRGKTVSVHEHGFIAEYDFLLGPTLHLRREQFEDPGFTCTQELQRPFGKYHPESERGAARILLDDDDLIPWASPLQEVAKKQAGRAGTDDRRAHGAIG